MRSRWWLGAGVLAANLGAALAACTGDDPRVIVDPTEDAGNGDALADQGGPADGSSDAATTCSRADPFGQANLLGGVNSATAVFHPRLTPDEREIFYQHGTTAIYFATRANRGSSFSLGSPIPLGDAATVVADPAVTGDTLAIYVALNGRIARMTRATRTSSFDAPVLVELGAEAGIVDSDPHILADESALYFTRFVQDGGQNVIWRAQGDGSGGFSPPVQVELGPDSFNNPSVSEDELEIWVNHGPTKQIYRATRKDDAGPFPTPVPVDDINGQSQLGGNPRPGWISPDGCRLYFAAGLLVSQIWMAERRPR